MLRAEDGARSGALKEISAAHAITGRWQKYPAPGSFARAATVPLGAGTVAVRQRDTAATDALLSSQVKKAQRARRMTLNTASVCRTVTRLL